MTVATTTIEASASTERSKSAFLSTDPVWRVGVVASVAAAAVTELAMLIPRAMDVTMEAGSFYTDSVQEIPPGSFAMSTFMWCAIGVLTAVVLARKAKHPARTFVVLAVAATALSQILPITASDTETATKVMLFVSHLMVAAVVIPLLAMRLSHAGAGAEQPATNQK